MSQFPAAPSGDSLHCLCVRVVGEVNALLRLLEPFVVHDVTPLHTVSEARPGGFEVSIAFHADAELARRLEQRVAAQVTVETARLTPAAAGRLGAAA